MTNSRVLRPLQVLHNRILKTMTFKHRCHPTNELHRSLGILKIEDIHIFKMCLFTYKYVNDMLPCIFRNIVHPRRNMLMTTDTRNSNLFAVTRSNSGHGKFLLNNYCFKLWHGLPNNLRESNSYGVFKTGLKRYLTDKY